MTTAVDTRIRADDAAAMDTRAPRAGPRRRLFAKYAAALVGLVSLVLLINGSLDVWFSYDEAKDAAIRLQREKADAAAQRIEEFIAEIERQIGWTTATQWASSPIEQRRFDFGRLQRQVPAITELIQLDGQGHEQLKVSRLSMDVAGGGADYSADPRFTEALAKKVWFGPVYFRKESEPYMTMAVAQSGRNAGVTVAEVNLKLIWDVITAIKIGKSGYAYVVDDKGRLIAHPDISRVLRNTDLSGLPQVAAARGASAAAFEPAEIVRNLEGRRVLSASAAIPRLGWLVFVEQPISEALAPLYTSVQNTGLLLLLGLVVAVLAGLLLARRMTGPIRALDAGAARIGAGALDHRIAVHTGDELEELAHRFNTMAADLQSSYADLEKKVEDRTAELKEALDQQTATAEVLGVINSSPGELAPVFEAMLERATRLCEAAFGIMNTYDGQRFHIVALHGVPAPLANLFLTAPPRPGPESAQSRMLRGEDVVHFEDMATDEAYRSGDPRRRAIVNLGGARSFVAVPLRKDGALLGTIAAYRQEVRPFSDRHVSILQNFAAQAVIAMENARLITETREALEQQTATAEVLQVINASPADLAPVFETVLEKATSLCEASFGVLSRIDGENFSAIAVHGAPPALAEAMRQPRQIVPGNAHYRLMQGEDVVQVEDITAEDVYRSGNAARRALADVGGARTALWVALRKDDAALGAFIVYRQEVRPFSDKQIALLQNFAAQAVIAMENARLITETREALEQQTATAEVLQVINSSPGDLAPVFDAMLEKATRLCGADHGGLQLWDGEKFRAVATRGFPEAMIEFARRGYTPGPNMPSRRIVEGERVAHCVDMAKIDDPIAREAVELSGARTVLYVALRKDDKLLGQIVAVRQEVRPFTDKQIALLENFAAQAVIAMENARLITETHEALEQQTATAEVLGVINSSPGHLAPVFNVILEKAHTLCGAAHGSLQLYDGENLHAVATHAVSDKFAEILRQGYRAAESPASRALIEGQRFAHIADCAEIHHPVFRSAAELADIRTVLFVPLRKDDEFLGLIAAARLEVRPFSEKQIALLESFAAQAVIAIENARLLNELRQRTRDLQESLEYQTASSDVLKVISQSGAELEPVLDTLVETAAGICRADSGFIFRLHDGLCRMVASFGIPAEYRDFQMRNPIAPGRGTLAGRTVLERRAVHIEDAATDLEYTRAEAVQLGRQRTMLGVPLVREDALIGVITLARSRVEPFTEKQIALVATFADQAVIAIENARLFNELRERTTELGRSVEELKMLSEVGRAVSSTLDLRSVLSTILTSSLGVTWANAGAIFRYSRAERAFALVEAVGWDEALARSVRDLRVPETESAMGEATARRLPIQLPDLAQQGAYAPLRDVTLAAGFHSALIVPLVGADRILGAVILMRQEEGEFPPETVRLMQTLASQSVLAIQNARMFREIADKSEQLALASQHKSQFLANMSHELRTPLNAILGYAELLVDGIYGGLPDRPKGVLERIQNNGRHLLALINDVLDLAKIEAGQLTLTLEDYALAEVVRSVVTATEPLATAKGLKFTTAVQDNMPMAHGDARRVSQVLLNLVGNAIKFTDAGAVEIRAASANGQFTLTVRDTGPGIADADQERIFGEFQQIDNSNTRQKGGTGLGLAISKRMVELQGGTISVESALGQGSIFRVVLPVHVDEMMEAA
jgi:GAF domain-containing protein/two-component sensor histidine kinase